MNPQIGVYIWMFDRIVANFSRMALHYSKDNKLIHLVYQWSNAINSLTFTKPALNGLNKYANAKEGCSHPATKTATKWLFIWIRFTFRWIGSVNAVAIWFNITSPFILRDKDSKRVIENERTKPERKKDGDRESEGKNHEPKQEIFCMLRNWVFMLLHNRDKKTQNNSSEKNVMKAIATLAERHTPK